MYWSSRIALVSDYIDSECTKALSEALKNCTDLQKLDLSSNSIHPDGMVALTESLKSCGDLQKLDLSSNAIGSEGAVALIEVLSCTDLQKLDLSSNDIGAEGTVLNSTLEQERTIKFLLNSIYVFFVFLRIIVICLIFIC